jgi:hypothetical protein
MPLNRPKRNTISVSSTSGTAAALAWLAQLKHSIHHLLLLTAHFLQS